MKKVIQNIALAAASIFLLLIVLEAVLTVQNIYLDYRYPRTKLGLGLWEYDPVLGWKQRANAEAIYANKQDRFRVPVKINSKGLHDQEYSYEKKPGITRILLLGDSVTAGLEVEPADSLDGQLERLLGDGSRYEVINGGVSGYGTDQALLFLKNELYKYHPDIIIYGTVLNDPIEILTIHQRGRAQGKPYFEIGANDALILKGVPVPRFKIDDPWVMVSPEAKAYYSGEMEWERETAGSKSFLTILKRVLALSRSYQWVKNRIEGARLEHLLVQLKLKTKDWTPLDVPESVSSDQSRLMKRLFGEMSLFSQSIGAKLMIYEYVNGIGEAPKRPTDAEQIAMDLKIPFVDLSKPFYGRSGGKDSLCYRHDHHWNEKGHQLAAETIYHDLKERAWV